MDKREKILAEAERLFSEKGYYGMGLTELLKACGIPKGSFYYYFPDGKLQLIRETLDRAFHHMEGGIRYHLSQESTAPAAFERMLLSHADGVEQGKHYASHFVAMIAIESVYLDPSVHEACKRIYTAWQQLYESILMSFGYRQPAVHVKAQLLFELIHGAMLTAWIRQDGAELRQLAPIVAKLLEEKE